MLFVLEIRDLPMVALLFTYGMSLIFCTGGIPEIEIGPSNQILYPLQYTTPFKLSAQLAEIAIECTFLGQKSSFWAIFLNRVGRFEVDLN